MGEGASRCLLFVGNKPLTTTDGHVCAKTNGQREKTVHLSRFLPSRISSFRLFFFPLQPPSPFVRTVPSLFSDPRPNVYSPRHRHDRRRLMMSIFHSSARANFRFSGRFAPEPPSRYRDSIGRNRFHFTRPGTSRQTSKYVG